MRSTKHFIRGLLAPFDFMGALFRIPPPPKRVRDVPLASEHTLSGLEQDAANLRQDWINVGNYINNAIDTHERESSRKNK